MTIERQNISIKRRYAYKNKKFLSLTLDRFNLLLEFNDI